MCRNRALLSSVYNFEYYMFLPLKIVFKFYANRSGITYVFFVLYRCQEYGYTTFYKGVDIHRRSSANYLTVSKFYTRVYNNVIP